MEGKLIIFSAPSGSGKTTIVHRLLEHFPNVEFSISATSRSKREKEIDGTDYYFMDEETFRKKIEAEEFLEWEEVYKGSFYGTLKREIERIHNKGHHVIFDVDVVGGLNIKNYGGANALSVFIKPPSIEVLEERLKLRSSETPETLKKRLDKAAYELTFADKFDVIIVNDGLEKAVEEAIEIIGSFLRK